MVTVGELIDLLSKYEPKLPVIFATASATYDLMSDYEGELCKKDVVYLDIGEI